MKHKTVKKDHEKAAKQICFAAFSINAFTWTRPLITEVEPPHEQMSPRRA
jgi:hypothetical protein